jgi:hypothetical protein
MTPLDELGTTTDELSQTVNGPAPALHLTEKQIEARLYTQKANSQI